MPHSEAVSPMAQGNVKPAPADLDANGCASPSSVLNLSRAVSPRATPKSVSISNQAETISPLLLPGHKSIDEFHLENNRSPRRPSIKGPSAHRLSGRPPLLQSSPALRPFTSSSYSLASLDDKDQSRSEDDSENVDGLAGLVDQVTSWMQQEMAKRSDRKAMKKGRAVPAKSPGEKFQDMTEDADQANDADDNQSEGSDGEPDFEKLKNILKLGQSLTRTHRRKSSILNLRHKLSIKKLQRKASGSDTDYPDYEVAVPTCDVLLDNSKTLSYTGGASSESEDSENELQRVASFRDQDAWAKFKFETLRLIHTLRLKGWKKVPLELSHEITVQRLSGALTNAVYVVEPPSELPPKAKDDGNIPKPRKPPPKLLLRIYGPQVEHLIDREAELAILRRLARKRIGPRLLGTFANGRFEEFFHAQTLTPADLRNPDTSRQIAKRMRELHEGIELLDKERDDGPFVWRNWDKWVKRVEQVVSWLDSQVIDIPHGYKPTGSEAWKRRGFICGVPWKRFRAMVEKYRQWLDQKYGGPGKIKDQLIFAHNDTQYGNILRLVPTGESPLLLPANTHKQLVVIDFEYSNANLPGMEFANHFTEWCYNYHDERKPYACNTNSYPTPEEQERFVRAYVRHRPHFNVSTPKLEPQQSRCATPTQADYASKRPTTNISDFMLDARAPPSTSGETGGMTYDEKAAQAAEDVEVARLMEETRLWRLANTAQWVAWGIVQAKVPGMPNFDGSSNIQEPETADKSGSEGRADLGERADLYRQITGGQPAVHEDQKEVEEEEFDYLGYAQHRAMFFWGDAIQMGLLKEEELPGEVRAKLKRVPY